MNAIDQTVPARDGSGSPCRARRWAGWAALLLAASGCSLLHHGTTETKSVLQSLAGRGGAAGTTNGVAALQSEIMREADQYVGAVAQATDQLQARLATPETRVATQQWKLNEATAAYVNASGDNPARNAVDMVVLATLSRMVVEDYWVGQRFGDAARPLLETHRQLETNAWSFVRAVLTPEQQAELRNLLVEWHRQNPNQHNVAATRLTEFVNTLPQAAATSRRQNPGSVFSLLYLNPLAGLDPTTRAIEQTRYLAERGMFYAQRAPTLLGWQVELTTYQLAAEPETRQVLTNLNEVAQSTTVFAQTAEGLPKLVNEQREAAINQLLAGVAHERSNILVTLSAQEAQLRELLPQVRQTLTAGGDMANSVNGAVKSLDAFVRYVSPPETNSPPPDTNSPPFNILDYGKAASQIEAMAKEINTLLTSVNQSVPQLTRVTEQATVNAKEVVNHAFRLGLVLILVFLVGAVLAGLAWRFLTRERRPRAGKSGSA